MRLKQMIRYTNIKALGDHCKTTSFAQLRRQAQILIREILNGFLWLHKVKRQRYIFALMWDFHVPHPDGFAFGKSNFAILQNFPCTLTK